MNTVLEAREASVRYLDAVEPPLVQKFDLLAGAPGGVARLRELILCLATAGRLAVTRCDQSHWQRLALDQVGEWGSGGTPSKSHPEYYAGGTIPWLVIGDLNDGVVQSAATCISDLGLRNSSAKIVEPGTVLVAMYGSIGKLGVAGLRCATNQAIAFCRPNADVVTGDFLFLFLRSIRASLLQRGQGLAQQNISQKILRNIEISVPPLAEQARIVARVGELMQLCDALEAKGRLEAQQHARLLETLLGTLTDSTTPEELAANWQRVAEHFDLLLDRPEAVDVLEQTVLQLAVRGLLVPQDSNDEPADMLLHRIRLEKKQYVAEGKLKLERPLSPISAEEWPFDLPSGWTWVRWADIALKIGDIDHKMPAEVKEGIPYVSPRDFYGVNGIDYDGAKRIAYGDYLELSKKIRPELGDLIYPRYGTIGVVRRVTDEREFLASYSCAIIKVLREFIDPDYQYLFSASGCAMEQAAKATNKTTQPNVGLRSIQEFLFPLPPIAEQSRIVARVAELRRLCTDLRQRLAASQATQLRLAEALVESVVSA